MVILGSALSPMAIDEQIESSSSLGAIRVDELDHYDEAWIPPFTLKDGVRLRTNEKFSDFYELKEEIGQGKFGTVYRCVERNTGLTLAAKSIRLKKDTDIKKVEKEVNIMTRMRHKCIAQIYDAFVTHDSNVLLVMEIVEGGELFDRVEEDSYILTEMAVALIMHQILEAIKYIHSQNIIHLDLKPENIMCVSKASNQVKLIDFGLAQYYDGQSDLLFMAGTPEFAAPEVIRYEPLSFHTDMWSLGVITYILLSGISPFLGETTAHTYCNVEKANWSFCAEFAENGISEEAKDFISKLLVFQKEKRMLPDECLQHKWIVQCRDRANSSRSATPVNLPNIEKPLDVTKLRQYIRNKRFRRIVFGVMFLNSVVKMMHTFKANKSARGIDYVKSMIKAADEKSAPNSQKSDNLVRKVLSKKAATEAMDTTAATQKELNETKQNGHRFAPKTEDRGEVSPENRRRRSGDQGSKKKRSKSATRKTDKTRTRSSTEQTSKKKQKTELNEKSQIPIETYSKTHDLKAFSKSPVSKRTVKFDENRLFATNDNNSPNTISENSSAKKVLEKPRQKKAYSKSPTRKSLPAETDSVFSTKEEKVADLLKKLETKNGEMGGHKPLAFAVTAVPLQLGHKKQEAPQKKSDEVVNHTAKAGTSKTFIGELECRTHEEECTKIAKKKVKKENTVQKSAGDQLKTKTTIKSCQNEVVASTMKKTINSEKATPIPRLTEDAAKVAFRSRIEEIERLANSVKLEKSMENSTEVTIQRQKWLNKNTLVNNKLTAKEKYDQKLKMDSDEGILELQCKRLNRVQVREGEKKYEKMEVDTTQKVTVKKVKKKKTTRSDEQQSPGLLVGLNQNQKILCERSKPTENKFGHGVALRKVSVPNRFAQKSESTEVAVADVGGWSAVGEDVFDFNLLRKKLQSRIMGMKDDEDLAVEEANKNKCERRVKLASNSLHVKRAMKKWFSIDKEQQNLQKQQVI